MLSLLPPFNASLAAAPLLAEEATELVAKLTSYRREGLLGFIYRIPAADGAADGAPPSRPPRAELLETKLYLYPCEPRSYVARVAAAGTALPPFDHVAAMFSTRRGVTLQFDLDNDDDEALRAPAPPRR